jgi:hypothetical protein
MTSVPATKSEFELLRQELHSFRDSLQQDLLLIQRRLTIRLSVMTAVGTALLFAGLKFG